MPFRSRVRTTSRYRLKRRTGLIRVQCDSAKNPFLFVSGITDRFGFFDSDNAPRSDAQNTAAAHNAGVVVTWLLASLDKALGAQPDPCPFAKTTSYHVSRLRNSLTQPLAILIFYAV